jgi:hypothetical protein
MRFVIRDPKKASSGSAFLPRRAAALTQDVVGCQLMQLPDVVFPLPRDPGRSSRKQCFTYFLTVVHFRKLLNEKSDHREIAIQ